jgi:putative PIG3 family NAD(P)H quinone oxidoreductase
VNRPDVLQRLGLYPMPPGAPTIPGLEVAGWVEAVGGGVERWREGDAVCALVAGGGYAEWCVAPAETCLPVPAGLSMAEAAGLPETWFTVWSNLVDRAGMRGGETLLCHGGTSGIGITAIDLCRVLGATCIVTCGSDEKCAAALEAGAAHAINYRTEDWSARTRELTGGRGVDVVLDMVGGDYVPGNLAALADDGRHVSIAFQRGTRGDVDLMLVMRRRLTLTGSMLRPRTVAFKAAVARALERDAWPAFADGRIGGRVSASFALEDAADAHRTMEAGTHVGKIVLTTRHYPAGG